MDDALLRFGSGQPTVTRPGGAQGRSPAIGRFGASVAALAILLAACGGGPAASPTVLAQATPSPHASPTTAATPEVTPAAAATPTPAVTPTADNIDAELAATRFMTIGTSSTLDQSGDHPNAATFSSSFPTTVSRIYAIYELDDGVADTVLLRWKRNGTEVAKGSFHYGAKTSYAWTWMNKPFSAGDYELTATLNTFGDTITIRFKVQ